MFKKLLFAIASAVLMLAAPAVMAQDRAGSDDNWNVTGPQWYNTKCGLAGFAQTYGLPTNNYRAPCSVPFRVCEFKSVTVRAPAEPDFKCEEFAKSQGEVLKTYITRWDTDKR